MDACVLGWGKGAFGGMYLDGIVGGRIRRIFGFRMELFWDFIGWSKLLFGVWTGIFSFWWLFYLEKIVVRIIERYRSIDLWSEWDYFERNEVIGNKNYAVWLK